ncbi:conserved domain protein [Listeria seeligeri FSL S4-171]|uniref:LPXTG cell wall anchor domain-containing protein n=1 Tax=Listeria seeligeri TaxID=1640 RepID=UPI0001EB7168|nr:LPXTG cell wall anchor domain-containing protein [Listeria seeligeri]EFS03997.1 conserved domain protein [Listeria seeligeri FSL S4-171]
MIFSKKWLSSILLIFSFGIVTFYVSSVRAMENSSTVLPTTGDAFSIWPIIIGVFLVLLAIVLFLKKKI